MKPSLDLLRQASVFCQLINPVACLGCGYCEATRVCTSDDDDDAHILGTRQFLNTNFRATTSHWESSKCVLPMSDYGSLQFRMACINLSWITEQVLSFTIISHYWLSNSFAWSNMFKPALMNCHQTYNNYYNYKEYSQSQLSTWIQGVIISECIIGRKIVCWSWNAQFDRKTSMTEDKDNKFQHTRQQSNWRNKTRNPPVRGEPTKCSINSRVIWLQSHLVIKVNRPQKWKKCSIVTDEPMRCERWVAYSPADKILIAN